MEIPNDVWEMAKKSIKKTDDLHSCEKCNGEIKEDNCRMDEAWGFWIIVEFTCGYKRCYPGCHECVYRLDAPFGPKWCKKYDGFESNCKDYQGIVSVVKVGRK